MHDSHDVAWLSSIATAECTSQSTNPEAWPETVPHIAKGCVELTIGLYVPPYGILGFYEAQNPETSKPYAQDPYTRNLYSLNPYILKF